MFSVNKKRVVQISSDMFKEGIPFSAVTFEVSFLSVIALLPVSIIYHLKAYVVNFQNSYIILIRLPWQRY